MNAVLDIWISASITAHDFVEADFWHLQLENMRNIYLPASEIYVHEGSAGVLGFYALLGEKLAAIFVLPEMQGKGIGKSLLTHAKGQRQTLTLSVYKANLASVGFYQSQGFVIVEEGIDEATGHGEYVMRFSRPV